MDGCDEYFCIWGWGRTRVRVLIFPQRELTCGQGEVEDKKKE